MLYGFDKLSVKWFHSFLHNRRQKVKIDTILELKENNVKSTLFAGFYREWSHNGLKSKEIQIKGISVFAAQIELATRRKTTNVIIIGDANLCTEKWDNAKLLHKKVSTILRNALEPNDLVSNNVGITYTADHTHGDNKYSESAIDHVYNSRKISDRIQISKLCNSSSDHVSL